MPYFAGRVPGPCDGLRPRSGDHQHGGEAGGDLLQAVTATVTTLVSLPAADVAWITPAGGMLRSLDGRVELHIPPGAVTKRTHFSYAPQPDLPNLPVHMRFAFALEAEDEEGQSVRQFAVPLTLSYAYTPGESTPPIWREPALFHLDEATGSWRPIEFKRAVRLTTISYNGSSVQVLLGYADRDDRPAGYDSTDWRFYTTQRLSSVTVQVKDNGSGAWRTVRRYVLSQMAGREYQSEVWSGGQKLAWVVTTWVSTTLDLPISGYASVAQHKKPRFVCAETVETYQEGEALVRTEHYRQHPQALLRQRPAHRHAGQRGAQVHPHRPPEQHQLGHQPIRHPGQGHPLRPVGLHPGVVGLQHGGGQVHLHRPGA